MNFSSIWRASGAAVVCLLLLAMAPDISAAKACKCLHKHVTTGTGPVQIETCLLGYREKGTRIKRVTHVRQVMRNLGDRSLTMHFSDDLYSFNPLVSINGKKTGCGNYDNYLGGILKPTPTDGGPWEAPWVPSQLVLEARAHSTKLFAITRFFECAPSLDDSHHVVVKIDHEYVISGDETCAPSDPDCRNARVRSRDGGFEAYFPDVRLVPIDEGWPYCVVK